MERNELLGNIPLFESLSPEDLETLSAQLEERTFEANKEVFKQGDPGATLFIIETGAIEIFMGEGKSRIILASMFPGQYFGELSLLDGAPRSAGAVCTKDSVLLALDRDDFVDFLQRKPEAAIRIMSEMSERMRQTNELMSRQVTKNVLAEEEQDSTLGERVADKVAEFGGSWTFIFVFGGAMLAWMGINLISSIAWDPMPYILLNLMLSTLAALQAPVIMMSQNRAAEKDKLLAQNDYHVNLKNEMGIDTLLRGQAELLQRLTLVERQQSTMSGQMNAQKAPGA